MIYRMDSFTENAINPVTNHEYDASWLVFILTNNNQYQQITGKTHGCAYTIKTSRSKCEHWMMAAGDFIGFCEANGKNAILVMSETEFSEMQNHYRGHNYNDLFLRKNEPAVLIHSTPMCSWQQIKLDGRLKCWSRLKAEHIIFEASPVGIQLGDPFDFSDYIMFGSGISGEIVVNSKQKGKITMDIDSEYLTGARLYFDARKMAADGLLVRDGCHIKVKDSLPLNPYLIWTATWDTIGLKSQVSTPRKFAEQADCIFQSRFKQ